jgi:hypothetical protein
MVWQDVFVGEDVLVRAISTLRRVFQDDPRTQHTIQTIPKVGYMLVGQVEQVEAGPTTSTEAWEEGSEKAEFLPQEGEAAGVLDEKPQAGLNRRQLSALVGGVLVLVLAGGAWFWNLSRHQGKNADKETAASTTQTDAAKAPAEAVVVPASGSCPILSGATYVIENKKSGSSLEVPVSSSSNGTQLDQWSKDGGNNQHWVVEANGPYWTFTNVASGKVLDVPRADRALGVQIDQWQSNHGPNQNWIAIPVCKIVSQSSGLLLDVDKASTANGAAIIQYTDNDGANQHWIFKLVKKPSPSPDSH